jgi:hypothetical protein
MFVERMDVTSGGALLIDLYRNEMFKLLAMRRAMPAKDLGSGFLMKLLGTNGL